MSLNEDTCKTCQQVAAIAADVIVAQDDDWIAYNFADVPGWTILATREHVDGAHELSEAQAATLGGHVRRLGAAVTAATGADRVHVVYLGENSRHFHFGFFPRQAGEPSLLGNSGIVAEGAERQDVTRARALVTAMRGALPPSARAS